MDDKCKNCEIRQQMIDEVWKLYHKANNHPKKLTIVSTVNLKEGELLYDRYGRVRFYNNILTETDGCKTNLAYLLKILAEKLSEIEPNPQPLREHMSEEAVDNPENPSTRTNKEEKMSKFKIGDKVKVIKNLSPYDKSKDKNIGIITTIQLVHKDTTHPYLLEADASNLYREGELELAGLAHKIDCTITENFLKEWDRMCKSHGTCNACGLLELRNNTEAISCRSTVRMFPAEAIAIVQKWSDEHPEKPPKTIKDDFLEKHPNARLHNDLPLVCIKSLGYESQDYVCPGGTEADCKKCWNKPLEEE